MFVAVFTALYAACVVLLLSVWLQDRRRSAERAPGREAAPDPYASHDFVFRTQA